MAKKKIIVLLSALFCAVFSGLAYSAEKIIPEIVMKKAFGELGYGKPVPVVFESATEIDGCVTADGKYMFYSSDRERGNFDIYLRSLAGIETVRITNHASRDLSPAVSPDGKRLAFISQREDPRGDIYVVKINPEDLIENSASYPQKEHDRKAKNISSIIDSQTNAQISVKDADPDWSVDSESIVFSSDRGGSENIWIISANGKNPRQLTTLGGIHPRFSPDGSKVVFISYRDNPQGDIYIVDLNDGAEKRITSTAGLKIYPSFGTSDSEFYYTLIDKDTNGDGVMDFKDRSAVVYLNSVRKISYRLTDSSISSFRSRYYPVYQYKYPATEIINFNGILVYSEQVGENISISIMPDYGIIPRRRSASIQYDLAEYYRTEENEKELYLNSLMCVYYYFGNRKDSDSVIYSAKALYDAAIEYTNAGDIAMADLARGYFKELSKKDNDYASIKSALLSAAIEKKDQRSVFERALAANMSAAELPFIREEAAAYYQTKNLVNEAADIYEKILKETPSYRRISGVYYGLGRIEYDKGSFDIPAKYFDIFKKGSAVHREKVVHDIINLWKKEKNIVKRVAIIEKKLAAISADKSDNTGVISAALEYSISAAMFEISDYEKAEAYLNRAVSRLKTTDILYYESNIALAQIALKLNRADDEERYLSRAAISYNERWNKRDFIPSVMKLISYYESKGADYEMSGEYKKAADLYVKYARLMTYLHLKKKFEDIYSEYSSRAHILYVDAYRMTKSSESDALDDLEKKYIHGDKEFSDLLVARLDTNKAHIYALGYIYILRAVGFDTRKHKGDLLVTDADMIDCYKKAEQQILWALSIDDSYVDPYILQGWMNQMIDIRRREPSSVYSGAGFADYNTAFQDHLWERNSQIYQKALQENDEARFPEKEGALHLNLGNSNFLLGNFPSALSHYEQVSRFKKGFGSRKEEALFRYHYSYCLWQMGDNQRAIGEMQRVRDIYRSMSGSRRAEKIIPVIAHLALYYRLDNNYSKAFQYYSEIIHESLQSDIKVDESRIYLEMAWCSSRMGNDAVAESYISRAESLLENEDVDSANFKLRVKIMGLIDISFWDLGQDSVVIGGSKIFSSLTTSQKKLLSLSMREEIFIRRGDIAKAAESVLKKSEIFKSKNTESDRDGYIRALNAAGYYYFQLGRYPDAKKYFEKASEFSTNPKTENLNGAFISIQNLANFEAFYSENSTDTDEVKLSRLNTIISRIDKYRTEYESKKFTEDKKILEKEAKDNGRIITDEELAALRLKITADAAALYSEIDLSRSTLDFYRAELYQSHNTNEPYEKLKENSSVYSAYRNAAEVFITASEKVGISPAKKGTLLMNAAVCRAKNSMAQKAYELYGNAEKIFSSVSKNDLLWLVYFREAELLRSSGSEIDSDYSRLADSYYKRAVLIIEECPALYASSLFRVKKLYADYASFLAERNEMERASTVYEKVSSVNRIMSAYSSPPHFGDADDSDDFSRYLSAIASLREKLAAKSTLLEKSTNAVEIKKTDDAVKESFAALENIIGSVKLRDRLMYSYMSVANGSVSRSAMGRRIAYRFEEINGKIYCWRTGFVSGSAVVMPADIETGIKSFMNAEGSTERYVVLNDTALKTIEPLRKNLPAYSLVPSVERVTYIADAEELSPEKDYVIQNGYANTALLKYDILGGDAENICGALYEKRAAPLIVVTKLNDTGTATEIIEAAIYAKVRSVLFSNSIQSVIASLKNQNGNILSSSAEYSAALSGGIISHKESFRIKAARRDRAAALSALSAADAATAVSASARADNLLKENLSAKMNARADEMSGKSFLPSARDALILSDPESVSYYIYALLSTGNVAEADKALAANESISKNIPEWKAYKSIINLSRTGNKEKIDTASAKYIDPGRLSLIAAKYETLVMSETDSYSDTRVTYPMSDSQILSQVVYSRSDVKTTSRRAQYLSAMIRDKNISVEKAVASAYSHGGLSIYPMIAALRNGSQSVTAMRLVNITSYVKSDAVDYLVFLDLYSQKAKALGLVAEYEKAIDEKIRVASESGINFIHAQSVADKAEFLNTRGRYSDSKKILNDVNSDKTVAKLEKRYSILSAECDIFTGNIQKASNSLTASEATSADDRCLKALLLAHSERMKIIQNPAYASTGFSIYEKNMKEAVSLLTPDLYTGFHRRDLLSAGIDFMISFSASKMNNVQALYYEEIKKQLNRWEFLSVRKDKLLTDSRVAEFQTMLPDESAALYISRNENDLFAWIIDREYISPVRIAGGYTRMMQVVAEYESASNDLRSVKPQSGAIAEILSRVLASVSTKKTLYIIPDRYTEKIPFEIAGRENYIVSGVDLYYLSSISSAFTHGKKHGSGFLVSGSPDSLETELGIKALTRAGLSLTKGTDAPMISYYADKAGILQGSISVSGRKVSARAGLLYFAYGVDVAYNSIVAESDLDTEASSVVLSSSGVSDVNIPVFAGSFSEKLAGKRPYQKAFSDTVRKMMTSEKYSHPAYWAGIRLYIKDLAGDLR